MRLPFRLPMALAALKNLFSKPATLVSRLPYPGAHGALRLDLETCNFCGLCARRCPCTALEVSIKERRFVIEQLRCTSCGICVDLCNKDSLSLSPEPLPVQRADDRHDRVELRGAEPPAKKVC